MCFSLWLAYRIPPGVCLSVPVAVPVALLRLVSIGTSADHWLAHSRILVAELNNFLPKCLLNGTGAPAFSVFLCLYICVLGIYVAYRSLTSLLFACPSVCLLGVGVCVWQARSFSSTCFRPAAPRPPRAPSTRCRCRRNPIWYSYSYPYPYGS